MEEDAAHINLPQALEPELEATFAEICYSVRERVALPAEVAAAGNAASYAVQLIEEIEARQVAGALDREAYAYCRAAAAEILSLETIYFENQFVKI